MSDYIKGILKEGAPELLGGPSSANKPYVKFISSFSFLPSFYALRSSCTYVRPSLIPPAEILIQLFQAVSPYKLTYRLFIRIPDLGKIKPVDIVAALFFGPGDKSFDIVQEKLIP